MSDRKHQLLDRELDGELSEVERAELDRLTRLDPPSRRDRQAWRRVEGAIKAAYPAIDEASIARTANAIAGRAAWDTRTPVTRVVQPALHLLASWRRPLLAGSGALIVLTALAIGGDRHPGRSTVRSAAAPLVSMRRVSAPLPNVQRAPVEFDLAERTTPPHGEDAPVTIRF